MGVPVLWDAIREGFDTRVSFSDFVQDWAQSHPRPLRIAIDAYQWLFESHAGITAEEEKSMSQDDLVSMALRLFLSRTRVLISLNVSFIYVFDGKFKPRFKRKLGSSKDEQFLQDKDFETYYDRIMRRLVTENYNAFDTPEISKVKELLRHWNVKYCEAPADGEAEAARLQKEGIVDYVLSNDTDTLAHGATHVLRNFSKHVDDLPSSAINRDGTTTRNTYMVTPVDMDNVEGITGFNASRMTFFSILLGADYNKGVSKLGQARASQLALCGTDYIARKDDSFEYEDLDDFSDHLLKIYTSDHSSEVRRAKYLELQQMVKNLVKDIPKQLFGRNEKNILCDGFAPDFVVNLYYKPMICPDLFQWSPSTNNAESKVFPLLNFNPMYECLSPYKFAATDMKVHFATNMTKSYLLKFILEHMGDQWEDKEFVKFDKVRLKRADGQDESDVLNVRYFLFEEFKPKSFYHDPDILKSGYLEPIPIKLLPRKLADDLFAKEADRQHNQKSPTKSPRKKKLPASTKSFKQDLLSPDKLSPKKRSAKQASESSTGVISPAKPKNLNKALREALTVPRKPLKKTRTFMPDDFSRERQVSNERSGLKRAISDPFYSKAKPSKLSKLEPLDVPPMLPKLKPSVELHKEDDAATLPKDSNPNSPTKYPKLIPLDPSFLPLDNFFQASPRRLVPPASPSRSQPIPPNVEIIELNSRSQTPDAPDPVYDAMLLGSPTKGSKKKSSDAMVNLTSSAMKSLEAISAGVGSPLKNKLKSASTSPKRQLKGTSVVVEGEVGVAASPKRRVIAASMVSQEEMDEMSKTAMEHAMLKNKLSPLKSQRKHSPFVLKDLDGELKASFDKSPAIPYSVTACSKKKKTTTPYSSPYRKEIINNKEEEVYLISSGSDTDDDDVQEKPKGLKSSPAKEVIRDIDFSDELSDLDDNAEVVPSGSQMLSSQALIEDIDFSDGFSDDSI